MPCYYFKHKLLHAFKSEEHGVCGFGVVHVPSFLLQQMDACMFNAIWLNSLQEILEMGALW